MKFDELVNEVENINEGILVIPATKYKKPLSNIEVKISNFNQIEDTFVGKLGSISLSVVEKALNLEANKNGIEKGVEKTENGEYKILRPIAIDTQKNFLFSKEKSKELFDNLLNKTRLPANKKERVAKNVDSEYKFR